MNNLLQHFEDREPMSSDDLHQKVNHHHQHHKLSVYFITLLCYWEKYFLHRLHIPQIRQQHVIQDLRSKGKRLHAQGFGFKRRNAQGVNSLVQIVPFLFHTWAHIVI